MANPSKGLSIGVKGLAPKEAPTVWLRSIRYHTYQGIPQDVGAIYMAHADMVETIVDVLKFAVRDAPPPKAVRTTPPAPDETA